MAERLRVSTRIIDRYQDALALGHRRFDAEARPMIEKMRQYFLGNQWPSRTIGEKTSPVAPVVANLLFADVKVMLPALALRNPRIFIKPTAATVQLPTPQGMPVAAAIINGKPVPVLAAAKAKEALVNWRWRDLGVTRQVRRALIDSLLGPFGLIKLGYTMQTEKVSTDGEPELLEVNEMIKGESPFAVRWSPLDFRVDPEARYPDLSDASWIAFGWRERLETVQKNPRFRNTRDLKANVEVKTEFAEAVLGPGMSESKSLRKGEEGDYKRVQLWEIWDKRDGTRIVLADDHDKALAYDDWPTIHRGFPCKTLVFTEHPDTLYGPPDLWQVINQQDAYNEAAAIILNHVKRFLRKYVTTRGTFDEKEMAKLLMPIDGVILEANSKLAEAIMPVPDAPIPVDVWQTRVNFREDHDRISGVADFMRGAAEKVDTATEASLLQSNLNVRTNDTRNIVETFAEEVARELLGIDSQMLELPKAIPVIGPDGAMALGQFLRVQTRETLLAEVDVEIEVGSMQPINQQLRKRDILEIYSLLRNDPLVDQFELRRRLLPAYQDSIPDLDRVLLNRQQAAQVIANMQAQGQAQQQQQQAARGPQRPVGRPRQQAPPSEAATGEV